MSEPGSRRFACIGGRRANFSTRYAKLRSNEAAPDNTLVGDVKVFDFSGNLITETIGARLWYLDSAQKQDVLESVEDWLYEPQWVIKDTAADELSPEGSMTGTWIIFRDQQGIGDAVCAQLRQHGATCLCVDHGEQPSEANDALITISPDNADDYDGLLRAAARQDSVVKGIVHLWSLDASDPEKADLGAVQEAQTIGPVSVLRMVQALDRAQQPTPPKLWLISRGAQPAGEKPLPLALLQSPLWGLGRTIAMENGDFWGGQVDLDPSDAPAAAAGLLLRQLVERRGEDQTAFRERPPVCPAAGSADENDVQARTSSHSSGRNLPDHGRVGRHRAHHCPMVGHPRRSPSDFGWAQRTSGSATMGRGRTEKPSRASASRPSENWRASVRTSKRWPWTWVTRRSVSEMVGQCLRADHPPLRGVFHAAGVMQYEALGNQTPEQMRDVFAAKMVGGWLLHRLLADVPLELFVLFSSSSSLLSSPMMGSYSAANVFLDALAHHRRATGKAALSVNWGTWAEAGMATRFQAKEESKRHGRTGATKGVGVLIYATRIGSLGAIAGRRRCAGWRDADRLGVMAAGLRQPRRCPLPFAVDFRKAILGHRPATADGESREHILAAQPETRAEMLGAYLAKQMSRILKVSLGLSRIRQRRYRTWDLTR